MRVFLLLVLTVFVSAQTEFSSHDVELPTPGPVERCDIASFGNGSGFVVGTAWVAGGYKVSVFGEHGGIHAAFEMPDLDCAHTVAGLPAGGFVVVRSCSASFLHYLFYDGFGQSAGPIVEVRTEQDFEASTYKMKACALRDGAVMVSGLMQERENPTRRHFFLTGLSGKRKTLGFNKGKTLLRETFDDHFFVSEEEGGYARLWSSNDLGFWYDEPRVHIMAHRYRQSGISYEPRLFRWLPDNGSVALSGAVRLQDGGVLAVGIVDNLQSLLLFDRNVTRLVWIKETGQSEAAVALLQGANPLLVLRHQVVLLDGWNVRESIPFYPGEKALGGAALNTRFVIALGDEGVIRLRFFTSIDTDPHDKKSTGSYLLYCFGKIVSFFFGDQ